MFLSMQRGSCCASVLHMQNASLITAFNNIHVPNSNILQCRISVPPTPSASPAHFVGHWRSWSETRTFLIYNFRLVNIVHALIQALVFPAHVLTCELRLMATGQSRKNPGCQSRVHVLMRNLCMMATGQSRKNPGWQPIVFACAGT